jgi:hypothetical protein
MVDLWVVFTSQAYTALKISVYRTRGNLRVDLHSRANARERPRTAVVLLEGHSATGEERKKERRKKSVALSYCNFDGSSRNMLLITFHN